MLTDYHVHIENGPYTLDWLDKFLKQAQNSKIDDLGISEHAYRFQETSSIFQSPYWDERRTEYIGEYLELLDAAGETLHKKLKKGIEMDYLPGLEGKLEKFFSKYTTFDYLIGSIHWLGDWGFDIPETEDIWQKADLKEVYLRYFNSICQLVDSELFDIVGHFDVIKVFGYEPQVFDQDLIKVIEKAVQKIKDKNMCIEISSAGLRKPVGEIYPKKEWLKLFYEADIPIVLSSDAHYPEHVGADYDQTISLAKEVGYDKIAIFEKRKYTLLPLG